MNITLIKQEKRSKEEEPNEQPIMNVYLEESVRDTDDISLNDKKIKEKKRNIKEILKR
ncbi:MAG: hypothetical protein ACRC42_00330 [Mycoplasma sp.]